MSARTPKVAAAWGILSALALSCAAPRAAGLGGAGRPLTATERAEVDGRALAAAAGRLRSLHCELRVHQASRDSRFRGTAWLWLARPDRLRLHLMGPHGAPVAMLAAAAGRVVSLDMANAVATSTDDRPAALDALLPLPPLGLDARGWVSLWLGEVRWPTDAHALWEGGRVRLSWTALGRAWSAWVAPDTGLWHRLEVAGEGQLIWAAEADARDAHGLPQVLRVRAPSLDPSQGLSQTEMRLREVEVDPDLPPTTFTLAMPSGFSLHPL